MIRVAQPALDDLIWQKVDDYLTQFASRDPYTIDLGTFATMAVARELMIARRERQDAAMQAIADRDLEGK